MKRIALLLFVSAALHAQTNDAQWLRENGVPAAGIGILRDGRLQQVKVIGELRKGVPATRTRSSTSPR